MVVAFAAAALVLLALAADLLSPVVRERRRRLGARRSKPQPVVRDPGRERRAEQKARALLRSCVNEEEWEMYRDLGFIRVWGSALSRGPVPAAAPVGRHDNGPDGVRRSAPECAYLLYPHRPIIAYLPKTRRLVGEYCVTFEDQTGEYGEGRLPDADDVLAKWMALTGDEDTVVSVANMHLPGRQVATEQVQRDLRGLAQWEQARLRQQARLGQADRPTAAAS